MKICKAKFIKDNPGIEDYYYTEIVDDNKLRFWGTGPTEIDALKDLQASIEMERETLHNWAKDVFIIQHDLEEAEKAGTGGDNDVFSE